MKRLLCAALLFLAFALPVRADHIGIYRDPSGTSCALVGGFHTGDVAIIHKFSLGATGSRFSLDVSSAPGTTIFALTSPFTVLPVTSFGDDTFVYGSCLLSPIVIGTLTGILAQGTIHIGPALGLANIVVNGCSLDERGATGGYAAIDLGYDPCCVFEPEFCSPLATESSTWGGVKALYR